jgi:CSLREA domain-containing protein
MSERARRRSGTLAWRTRLAGLGAATLVAVGLASPLREAAAAGTIAVTTTADINGVCPSATQCSLRTAVGAAQAAGDTVTVPAGTYLLTIPDENAVATDGTKGDLDITGAVTVVGAGTGLTVISGNGATRIFDIATSGDLTVSDVTLTAGLGTVGVAGHSHGAAIHNHGKAQVDRVAFTGNVAPTNWGGGGFTHASSAVSSTISNATFLGNTGASGGGAIETFGSAAGPLQLTNVTTGGNVSLNGSGAALFTGTGNEARVLVGGAVFTDTAGPQCSGGRTSVAPNVATDTSCAGFSVAPLPALLLAPVPGRDALAPGFGSLLIDAAPGLGGLDQLGAGVSDGNGDGAAQRDIGAVESPTNNLAGTDLAHRNRLVVRNNPRPPGQPTRVEAILVNRSAVPATGARLVYTLSGGLAFDSVVSGHSCAAAGQVVACELGTVAPAPLPVFVTIRVVAGAVPAGTALPITARLVSANPEATPGDNVATATVIVG